MTRHSSGACARCSICCQNQMFCLFWTTKDVCRCLQESLQSYGAIFSMLLRLKQVAHLLAALCGDLLPLKGPASRQTPQHSHGTGTSGSDPSASSQNPGGVGRGGGAGPQPAWVQQRLRALQLFRHEAAHFLGAVQAYMHSQLLGACWQRFQQRVEVGWGAGCTGDITNQIQASGKLAVVPVPALPASGHLLAACPTTYLGGPVF